MDLRLSSLLDSVHPHVGLQNQQSFMSQYQNDPLEKASVPGLPSSLSQGLVGHEFEDPPGLYEKVCVYFYSKSLLQLVSSSAVFLSVYDLLRILSSFDICSYV